MSDIPVVTPVSSQLSASLSTLWNDFNLPSNFIRGHLSTEWSRWQIADLPTSHLCISASYRPWPV